MSSEVCPFCGKTYKRLKSHLPHCKVAAGSKTPPTKHELTTNRTTSSPAPAALAEKTAKGNKSTWTSSATTGKKASLLSPGTPANTLSSSPSAGSNSLLSPAKKKQKLNNQTETSPPRSAATSKAKKKSLRALIEAAKSENITKELLGGTTAQTETKANPKKDLLSAEAQPKDVANKKATKTKQGGQFLSKDERSSGFLDSKVDSKEEIDLCVNNLFLKPGSGHEARITLQNVKSMLGRPNAPRQFSRPSVLRQVEATNNLKIRLDAGLVPPLVDAISRSVTPITLSDQQLLITSSKHTEIQSFKKQQAALMSLQDDSSPQTEPASPAAPLLSAHTPPPLRALGLNDGLNLCRHTTGLLAVSPPLTQFSSPFYFPPETLPVKLESDETRKQKTAANATEGVLTHRPLGQVRLRELPEWLACKTPSHPRDVVEMVQKGWQWYYRRYIDVRKGGVAGLGMLLAGYCVLSYIWSYPHIKLDRWRKYH